MYAFLILANLVSDALYNCVCVYVSACVFRQLRHYTLGTDHLDSNSGSAADRLYEFRHLNHCVSISYVKGKYKLIMLFAELKEIIYTT